MKSIKTGFEGLANPSNKYVDEADFVGGSAAKKAVIWGTLGNILEKQYTQERKEALDMKKQKLKDAHALKLLEKKHEYDLATAKYKDKLQSEKDEMFLNAIKKLGPQGDKPTDKFSPESEVSDSGTTSPLEEKETTLARESFNTERAKKDKETLEKFYSQMKATEPARFNRISAFLDSVGDRIGNLAGLEEE